MGHHSRPGRHYHNNSAVKSKAGPHKIHVTVFVHRTVSSSSAACFCLLGRESWPHCRIMDNLWISAVTLQVCRDLPVPGAIKGGENTCRVFCILCRLPCFNEPHCEAWFRRSCSLEASWHLPQRPVPYSPCCGATCTGPALAQRCKQTEHAGECVFSSTGAHESSDFTHFTTLCRTAGTLTHSKGIVSIWLYSKVVWI